MRAALAVLPLVLGASTLTLADVNVPPWNDPEDLPVPTWARSVVPKRDSALILLTPGLTHERRGAAAFGAHLPLFGMKRGTGCSGRYLLIGPEAWLCGDAAELSMDDVEIRNPPLERDGLPFRYYFVGEGGASGFTDPSRAADAAPEEELDPGFAVAITETRMIGGNSWAHSHHGSWIALRELVPARPSPFHGEDVTNDDLSFGWVLSAVARVFPSASNAARPSSTRKRYDVVRWYEEKSGPLGGFVRISSDGSQPVEWMARRDLAHPTKEVRPAEVEASERWIDVDRTSQTLVLYEGDKAVFATLISAGRGAPGSDSATPPGSHRIWVKLLTSTMDNFSPGEDEASIAKEDSTLHYSMEDVPYVQFFDGAVALHAAFWHDGFGRPKSHGCVNLSPTDAARLFAFTGPHLPKGWNAVHPTQEEKGTLVRVR